MWSDIETYLAAALEEDMGAGSDHETLQVAEIKVSDTYEPEHVSFPFAMIQPGPSDYGEQFPHQDGNVRIDDSTYQYAIVLATVSSDEVTARGDARTLCDRAEAMILSRYGMGGLTSSSGEAVKFVRPVRKMVNVVEMPGTNIGSHLGSAMLLIEVETVR